MLNLGEVQLFGLDGAKMPPKDLKFALSSTHQIGTPLPLSASNCNDGDVSGNYPNLCHTAEGDSNPTLTISYPCQTGSTSLGRVDVTNRADGRQERINDYTMDFKNASGIKDQPSWVFSGSLPLYSVKPGVCWVLVLKLCSADIK